jgi:DNA-binding NtrC family response regulator
LQFLVFGFQAAYYLPEFEFRQLKTANRKLGNQQRGFMSENCILIIEDQEDLAELYEATLKKAGYKVRIAYTGEEGIAEFRANGGDAVMLDMTLPEMHGSQVLREIRALDTSVPVIVITGEENDQLREQCERLGVHEYLAKPVDYDLMLKAVKHALETPAEESEIVSLRLTKRIVQELTAIDQSLERAITQLVEERNENREPSYRTQKNQG